MEWLNLIRRFDDFDFYMMIWGDDFYVIYFGVFEWGVSEDVYNNSELKVLFN